MELLTLCDWRLPRDYRPCREVLAAYGVGAGISRRGESIDIQNTNRWQVERTNSWENNFGNSAA